MTPGTKLGPYELVSVIGAGGMGEVWKARDTRLDRTVAIKISQAQFSERFEREARAIAALNHPNICQLYDVGPNYLVMELIDGVPLKGPLPLDQALKYGAQICDALDAAHKKGITHRDLKPANILVTKAGVKLLDFGLARIAPGPGDPTLTVAGAVMGTPAYMAPEQWEGKPGDSRSDIYTFGCVVYEMITGERVTPERRCVDSPALETVIRKCLERDPEERWQSARDIKAVLAMPAPEPAKPNSRLWIAVAAAMVLAGLAALGGWAVAHVRQSPAEQRVFRLDINPPEGGQFVFLGLTAGGTALSPDGKAVAFIAIANGKSGLWVRTLDSATPRLIPGTEGADGPFWSPDGKSIAFSVAGKLQRVDVAGGSPLIIADTGRIRGGSWSADGRIVYGTLVSGLFQVPASGGKPAPLTAIDAARGENVHFWPQVLPGGRFLFWVRGYKPELTGIYAASFAKPSEHVFLFASDTNALYAPVGDGKKYLMWLRSGTLLVQEFDPATLKLSGEPQPIADPVASVGAIGLAAASASTAGQVLYSSSGNLSQFSWFDRAGRALGVVGEPGSYAYPFRVSPDGRRAVISLERAGRSDLWLLDLERGFSTRFTSTSPTNVYPVWSPDSRSIVFTPVSQNLFRKDAGGSSQEERISDILNEYATDWSRDGHQILYYVIAPGSQRDLWILPVAPDGKPDGKPWLYLQTPFNEYWGRFAPEPNPKWVAFQSDESGRNEVYIQAFPKAHGKFQISTGGGSYPQWGPAGRELFYLAPDNRLMAVSLEMGADSVRPSAPRVLLTLPIVENGFTPYDTGADGQKFLVRAAAQSSRALTVLVDWPALLKKGAP